MGTEFGHDCAGDGVTDTPREDSPLLKGRFHALSFEGSSLEVVSRWL